MYTCVLLCPPWLGIYGGGRCKLSACINGLTEVGKAPTYMVRINADLSMEADALPALVTQNACLPKHSCSSV